MTDQHSDMDEIRIERLLRSAGSREMPDASRREAVFAAVQAQWRQVVAERQRRRRPAPGWALAASVAVAALAVWLVLPMVRTGGAAMAQVERVEGEVAGLVEGPSMLTVAVTPGAAVSAGMKLRTGAGGRVALDIDGMSVRLDEHSLVAFVAGDEIALEQGAVYVDTAGGRGGRLRIGTAFGIVEHLGTRYETRLANQSLRISVREGRVRLRGEGAEVQGSAGERLVIDPAGSVQREAILPHAADWSWAGGIAPGFEIEGRALPEFLAWVGRESGLRVSYVNAAAEREAQSIVMRGSVAGLAPSDALTAVLASTGLQARVESGVLSIGIRDERL